MAPVTHHLTHEGTEAEEAFVGVIVEPGFGLWLSAVEPDMGWECLVVRARPLGVHFFSGNAFGGTVCPM